MHFEWKNKWFVELYAWCLWGNICDTMATLWPKNFERKSWKNLNSKVKYNKKRNYEEWSLITNKEIAYCDCWGKQKKRTLKNWTFYRHYTKWRSLYLLDLKWLTLKFKQRKQILYIFHHTYSPYKRLLSLRKVFEDKLSSVNLFLQNNFIDYSSAKFVSPSHWIL